MTYHATRPGSITRHLTTWRSARRTCERLIGASVGCVVGVAALLCSMGHAGAECIDYSNYLHRTGYLVDSRLPPGPGGMVVSGSYAYFASRDLVVIDITDSGAPRVVSNVGMDRAEDVAVLGSYAYVADGYSGLQVIDISDPRNPQIIGSLNTPDAARGVAVSGSYVYTTTNSGLLVIDVSDPQDPRIAGSVSAYLAKSVAVSGAYACVMYQHPGTLFGKLGVIDISDPQNPRIVGSLDIYALDVAVSGANAYLAQGYGGFQVIDISDPQNPRGVGHTGTLGHAVHVAVSGTYAYIADEVPAYCCPDCDNPPEPSQLVPGIRIIEISDPQNPKIVGGVATDPEVLGMAASDSHLCFVEIPRLPDFCYRRLDPRDFGVIDITKPWNSPITGTVATPGAARGVALSGTDAFVADGTSGLQVIAISDPQKPRIVGTADTPDHARNVAVSGMHAFVADVNSGLQVIAISDPQNPRIVGTAETPGLAVDVAVSGAHAYVADGSSGLQVIEISDAENPRIVGSVATPGAAVGVALSGTDAFVADASSGLQVIQISDPENPQIVGSIDTPGNALDVAVSQGYAYVADEGSGLDIIEISDPRNPQVVASVGTPGAIGVTISGSYAYVAGEHGLQVVDITDPRSPAIVGLHAAGGARRVVVSETQVYVTGPIPDEPSMDGLVVLPAQCEPNRPPDCSGAVASVDELWPPNHRMVPVEVRGVTDPDGDPITVSITSVTQNEPVLGESDGRTCPDAVLEGDALTLRAERSGQGNGRVYVVSFTAEDGRGGTCDGSVRVRVPQDRGMEPDIVADGTRAVPAHRAGGGDDDPQAFDALAGCSLKAQRTSSRVVRSIALSLDPSTVRSNEATVVYALPHSGEVQIALYDITGRRVATVEDGFRAAGRHRTSWDARALSPGMYFYRLRVNGEMVSKPVLLLR